MKKLLISLLVAGVLVGTVYAAAAAITVGGVDDLGSGGAAVADLIPDITDTAYNLDADDNTLVASVDVTYGLAGSTISGCVTTVQLGASGDPDFGEGTSSSHSIDDATPSVVVVTLDSSVAAGSIIQLDVTTIC